ncbi:hypothetical protein J1N35_042096 [Gossypium stocksii]|uniref:Large ribosomal subunit protein uL2 C-terminal domain-containing protein n=1 Tax=Gossypium stocksii TaxID=47602 RepID=A0A9D3UH60_9ROSI|nr:hypothetical protein J1N35_042096 [Gossypium stocksii]
MYMLRNIFAYSVGYVSTEYAILSIPKTDILGGLRAYWTRVWMVCGACGPICKLLGCMRVETEAFPRFLQAGFVALPCGLGTAIHNIEITLGRGGQLARVAGAIAKLIANEGKSATLKLPYGEVCLISKNCLATVGQVGNVGVSQKS